MSNCRVKFSMYCSRPKSCRAMASSGGRAIVLPDEGLLRLQITIGIITERTGERFVVGILIAAGVLITAGFAARVGLGEIIIGRQIGVREGVIFTVRLAVGIIAISAIKIVDLSQVLVHIESSVNKVAQS